MASLLADHDAANAEIAALRAQVTRLEADRDAAREWARRWRRAARMHRYYHRWLAGMASRMIVTRAREALDAETDATEDRT